MAFEIKDVKNLTCVRLIVPHDPALDLEAMKDTDILERYDEDPNANEGLLKIKDGQAPTIFVCNFELSGKEAAKIKDKMSGGVDDEKEVRISYGAWQYAIVRTVLKDIQNPGAIKFKKDARGYVDDFTMTQLERFGVVQPIFLAYMRMTQNDVKQNAKN